MNVLKIIKFILVLLLLFLFTLVAVANKDPVSIKLMPFFTKHATLPPLPLSFVLFMAFLFGVLLVGLYAVLELIKQNVKTAKLKRQNHMLEKEIANLRHEPFISGASSVESSKVSSRDEIESHVDEDTLLKTR